jgi:hypothetical protein
MKNNFAYFTHVRTPLYVAICHKGDRPEGFASLDALDLFDAPDQVLARMGGRWKVVT